jgi:TolB-like protein/class 3 adenylate cyclase
MNSHEHRLKAILFSDIVGYSAVMSRNEQEAWELLQNTRDLHLEYCQKYNGELLKELGDGFLLCFNSVIDAVHCAEDLLGQIENDGVSKLRIGINLGDVISSNGDIFGEGVNVAARLQQEAGENEILVSESVYQNIKNQADLKTESIGSIQLKNISGPINVYRLGDKKVDFKPARSKRFAAYFLALSILAIVSYAIIKFIKLNNDGVEPTIAVLPFENLSDDPEQEYFSDGISDEIRVKLGFINGLTVRGRSSSMYFKNKSIPLKEIARDLNANYILEGSARSSRGQFYLNISLMDARSDMVLIPFQFQRSIDDVFRVQAEIAKSVAEVLQATLLPDEVRKVEKASTKNPEAHRFYLLAKYHFGISQSRENINLCLDYLDSAIELDSAFAPAYALKAGILLSWTGWGYLPGDLTIESARVLVDKAIELDPEISEAHEAKARLYAFMFSTEEANREIKEAIRLDPDNDLNHFTQWQILLNARKYDDALKSIKKTRELNPFSAIEDAQVGLTYFLKGELDSAIYELENNLVRFPENDHAKWLLGGCYEEKGEYEKAIDYFLDRSVDSKYMNWVLGYTYAKMGKEDSARKVLNYLLDRRNSDYVPPSQIALVYRGLGETDSMHLWLEKAHLERDWVIVRYAPQFRHLADQPPYNGWFGFE